MPSILVNIFLQSFIGKKTEDGLFDKKRAESTDDL
jgi:hypothetical protein